MMIMRILCYFLASVAVCFILLAKVESRSVTHRKDKDQATLDKEVLFEDSDYDDDEVLDLTPEEQKERLKKLVEKKIDANHDGFVDLRELRAWALKAFDSFEKEDYKEEFTFVDTDKDGFISWDEHAADGYDKDFSESNSNPKLVEQYKKEKKLFAAADVNQDRQLDVGEYLIFRCPRMHTITKKILIDDALERLDQDKDGAISLQEFLKEESSESDAASISESDTERFTDELDKDEDGKMRDDEIVQWIDPDNTEDANDEADHLMNESDSNNDLKLSSLEIVENHDLWVESDATDYGKQLLTVHDEF